MVDKNSIVILPQLRDKKDIFEAQVAIMQPDSS